MGDTDWGNGIARTQTQRASSSGLWFAERIPRL